jgi:hypothetical protein
MIVERKEGGYKAAPLYLERQVVVSAGRSLCCGWLSACCMGIEHADEGAVVLLDNEVKVYATACGKVLLDLIKLFRFERD